VIVIRVVKKKWLNGFEGELNKPLKKGKMGK